MEKIKTVKVLAPESYERLLEAFNYLSDDPLAKYARELKQLVPQVLNDSHLSPYEKVTRYRRLMKKIIDLVGSDHSEKLRNLEIETQTEILPGAPVRELKQIYKEVSPDPEEAIAGLYKTPEKSSPEPQTPREVSPEPPRGVSPEAFQTQKSAPPRSKIPKRVESRKVETEVAGPSHTVQTPLKPAWIKSPRITKSGRTVKPPERYQ